MLHREDSEIVDVSVELAEIRPCCDWRSSSDRERTRNRRRETIRERPSTLSVEIGTEMERGCKEKTNDSVALERTRSEGNCCVFSNYQESRRREMRLQKASA